MDCKKECEISSQLGDIKSDLTDIKNVIYRFDGIIAKQELEKNECIGRSGKLETEMKSEIEQIKTKFGADILDLKNKIEALQNRFLYIWTGITFMVPVIWALVNYLKG